jgi:hypothetical protein
MIVAASPDADNRLRAQLTSPTGKIVAAPEPASQIEISHCADVSGPHPITITPSAPDYFAVGGVDCPRSAIKRLRSR